MAVVDLSERRIVVRVVYDGPGEAGKTSNLTRLRDFFTARRRGELHRHDELDGRTQMFDWMQLDGGLVQGYGLRCQLITVPGQRHLARRRLRLLRHADAIVFVTESRAEAIDDAQTMLHQMRDFVRTRQVPFILQANKQDLPGALSPEALRDRLGLGPETEVVGARASDGLGVRETLVLAIRAAADAVQRRLLADGVDALAGSPQSREQLLSEVEALPARMVVEVAVPARAAPAVPATPAERVAAPEIDAPPLPDPDVPTGYIWPAMPGREALRELAAAGPPELRSELAGRHDLRSGSGASDLLVYRAGDWCLKTSPRRRHHEVEAARNALLALARKKSAIGDWLPPQTTLCLRPDPDPDRGFWLWTVTPWLITLRDRMALAADRGDSDTLGAALAAYARAIAAALLLAARRGLQLDVHPSNFAIAGGRLCYIDDDIGDAASIPSIGHAILQRFTEYQRWPEALDRYAGELEARLLEELEPDERERCGLIVALEETPVRSDRVATARGRLLGALAGA